VAIDGKIVDFRTDIDPGFAPGAAQFLSQSPTLNAVGKVQVSEADPQAVADQLDIIFWSNLLGVLGMILLIPGLVFLAFALGTSVNANRGTLMKVGVLSARAYGLLLIWLSWWFAEAQGWLNLSGERWVAIWGTVALLMGTFNLLQMLRQSTDGARLRQWVSLGMAAVFVIIAFEGLAQLHPQRRHHWTTHWHQGLQPRHYWVYDPMIRRLNPWFVDMRFKRRDRLREHPYKTRVVVFGGSQTYGWGIPAMDRMTFSDQLERILEERGHKDVEVLNAAFPGVKRPLDCAGSAATCCVISPTL
jgi:hypothetical protein